MMAGMTWIAPDASLPEFRHMAKVERRWFRERIDGVTDT